MLLSFDAKTIPPISSESVRVTVDSSRFSTGAWKPNGKEFIASFEGGMMVALSRDDAAKFLTEIGSKDPLPPVKESTIIR